MNPVRTFSLVLCAMLPLACGSSGSATAGSSAGGGSTMPDGSPVAEPMPDARLTADDVYRAELIDAEFTDEVDEKRYKAIGNSLEEISPRRRVIYFVGKLRRVPTQARIQVLWYHDRVAEPMVVSDVHGSDTFSFISTFTPPGRKFIPGNYTVKVTVNDRVVGTKPFVIKGQDPYSTGLMVGGLQIAKKVHKTTGAPVKPDERFSAASILYAVFNVKNCMMPTELTVNWYRGESLFSESSISVDGNGRFNATVESPSGLPRGAYKVEVEHEGQVIADTRFAVGQDSLGPSIDTLELGTELGRGQMPKQPTTRFGKGTSAIVLGLRFLDLLPNSEILVEWVLVDGASESVYHTVNTPVQAGGSGAMNTDWSPGEIYPGKYKVVVYINDEMAAEKEFSVK
ncbi:MAG: hypothetical protein JXR76_05820 [Deltaproteobacteria bacterium]|nr:hypothetical protein [Deltaproteobacteria bacterium]